MESTSIEQSGRFEIVRRIGAGGMGVVYEAIDREKGGRVAIKTIRDLEPRALARFKQEFRALSDLAHPNLVSLGELVVGESSCYFTMEYVPGVDWLAWVRPRPDPPRAVDSAEQTIDISMTPPSMSRDGGIEAGFDEARLRGGLSQLVEALASVHASGRIHRDVKPSNIRVTEDGRLVLLDFGLVSDSDAASDSTDGNVAGTVEYMAPEQAAALPLGPSADWYSVGAMLWEALVGRPPFVGRPIEVMMAKQQHEPAAPSTLVEGVPPDLEALCLELLRFEPHRRPREEEIRKVLGVSAGVERPSVRASHPTATQVSSFVGREHERARAHAALRRVRGGEPAVVIVTGESGIGKTAFVRQFLAEAAMAEAPPLVFGGRCYERESVPFRAFDGVVDAITRHLTRLDPVDAAVLLPKTSAALARLFPVLRRVPGVARLSEMEGARLEGHELRGRGFAALRDLVRNLAGRATIAIVIEDFQWADADSLALMTEFLLPGAVPPMLLVVTAQTSAEADEEPAPLAAFRDTLASFAPESIALEPLTPEEARALLAESFPDQPKGAAVLDRIAQESGGHPLFLGELAFCYDLSSFAVSLRDIRLDDVLASRVARLDAPSRRLVEILAVAGSPLWQSTARVACGLDGSAYQRLVSSLRVAHMVRSSGNRPDDRIELYHGRQLEAILSAMSESRADECHEALVDALETSGEGDRNPQSLLFHLEASGERARAARLAERAAAKAADSLAFDRAAELWRTTIRLSDEEGPARRSALWRNVAMALVAAGRGVEAAEAFENAIPGADRAARLECQRRAAEQLLQSGYIEKGIEAIRTVLADHGMTLPSTPSRALLRLLLARLRLRLRGFGFSPREESEIPPAVLSRLDVFRSVSVGLAIVDSLRGAEFQARGLLEALEAGEPRRVAQFIAFEAAYIASQGRRSLARASRVHDAASVLLGGRGDPYLQHWVFSTAGFLSYFSGDFVRARERFGDADRKMKEFPAGSVGHWEMMTVRLFRLMVLRYTGDFRVLREGFDETSRDAARRGDRYTETTLARALNIVWLVDDRPDAARADLRRKGWSPPEKGFHLQHWYELRAEAEIALYERESAGWSRLRARFRGIGRSLLSRVQTVRSEGWWLRAKLAILAHAGEGRAEAARDIRRSIARLRRERLPHCDLWADLLAAALAEAEGNHESARGWVGSALDRSRRAGYGFYETVVSRTEAALLGDSARREAEEGRLRALGIRDPAKFLGTMVPGLRAD